MLSTANSGDWLRRYQEGRLGGRVVTYELYLSDGQKGGQKGSRALNLGWDAGPGETEVLSYARANPDVRAIVDDDHARRCARSLGVRTLGTCGVLVLAKQRGLITGVEPGLRALTEAGLWLSPSLIRAVLNEAGEG